MDSTEQLQMNMSFTKIMEEFDIEIPFLTWAFMTYEELLELEEELKNK